MIPGSKLALPLVLLASGAHAQLAAPDIAPQDLRQAKKFQNLVVPGNKVAPAVRKLTKLKWHKKLSDAATHARAVRKPILVIQVLGTLKGYT